MTVHESEVDASLAATLTHVEALQQRIEKLARARDNAVRQAAHRATSAHESGLLTLDELAAWYGAYRAALVDCGPGRTHDGWTRMWPDARRLATRLRVLAGVARRAALHARNEDFGWSGGYPLGDQPRPPTGQAVVYVLYQATEPIYLGSTAHFGSRLSQHRHDKQIDRWIAYPCADRAAAYALEDKLLREQFPRLNRRRSAP